MGSPADNDPINLDRFRPYLIILAEIHMGEVLRGKVEACDVVQSTLADAHRCLGTFRGRSNAELAGWLRSILVHNLIGFRRNLGREKRDVQREQSLEAAMELSSQRFDQFLAADQSSPSECAQRHENAAQLAEAMLQLSEGQRQAIQLHYFQQWTFQQISDHLGCTTSTVAGLLARGSKQLRDLLQNMRDVTPT